MSRSHDFGWIEREREREREREGKKKTKYFMNERGEVLVPNVCANASINASADLTVDFSADLSAHTHPVLFTASLSFFCIRSSNICGTHFSNYNPLFFPWESITKPIAKESDVHSMKIYFTPTFFLDFIW
jgi:hypothetical protein